jgi:hypothetical protein
VGWERKDGYGEDGEKKSESERAIDWPRVELQVDKTGETSTGSVAPIQSISIFMGHWKDDKVPCGIGKAAADVLSSVGVTIVWEEYEDLVHWYSGDMLRNVVKFLSNLPGWEDTTMKGDGECIYHLHISVFVANETRKPRNFTDKS